MTPPVLLHFRISHYNEKVRWALDYKGWPHLRQALVPGFHIPRVRWLTGQNKVPVIRLDGRLMHGSSAILEEIEKLRPDPPLFPSDPEDRARAMDIQSFFDDEVAPDLRRLFWQTYLKRPSDCARMAADGFGNGTRLAWRMAFPVMRPALHMNIGLQKAKLERAHERLHGYFDRLESELRPSGYLIGDGFSVADLAAASVMTAIIRPKQFSYPLPEPWPPELVELRASVSERRGFQWVLDMYARHRGTSCEIEN